MLVAMEHKFWFGSLDVSIEGAKSNVDVVITIMNEPRRVVCDENVDGRKIRQQPIDLEVFVEVIAAGFIFPRTAKATELNAAESHRVEMQISDPIWKRRARIVISLDRQDVSATALLCHGKN